MEDNSLGSRSVKAMTMGGRVAEATSSPAYTVEFTDGLWRSLVARLTGGQEVAGSNPASPTTNRSPDPTIYSPLYPPLTWMLCTPVDYNQRFGRTTSGRALFRAPNRRNQCD